MDLPNELLNEIVSYLSPIDSYAIKTSCTRLYATEGSLRSAIRGFQDNPWHVYCAKAWSEKQGSPRLLCVLCRTTHDRGTFLPSYRKKSALLRWCGSGIGAIEVGQSRLDLSAIDAAMKSSASYRKLVKIYPHRTHKLGVQSGLTMVCSSKALRSPCHSPFESFRTVRYDRYSLSQEIEVKNHEATLSTTLYLRLPTRMSQRILAIESFDARIQRWLARFKINGGLWLCPHTPTSDKAFRELLSQLFHGFLEDAFYSIHFNCRYCDTAIKLHGYQHEYEDDEVTPDKEFGDDEEDGESFLDSTVGMNELRVEMRKGLGTVGIGSTPALDFTEKFIHHLSTRIPTDAYRRRKS